MKVRLDFVTNSSSSSYCVIATGDEQAMKAIYKIIYDLDAYGDNDFDEQWPKWDPNYGYQDGENGFNFWGYYEEPTPYFLGYDAEELLKTMTIPEACEWFVKTIKERFGISVPLDSVSFKYGEMGEG